MTSGSLAIDYSVVSGLMIPDYTDLTRMCEFEDGETEECEVASEDDVVYSYEDSISGDESDRRTLLEPLTPTQYNDESDRRTPLHCSAASPLFYTEQLVLFSSLGHYLGDPLEIYPPERETEGETEGD